MNISFAPIQACLRCHGRVVLFPYLGKLWAKHVGNQSFYCPATYAVALERAA